MSETDLAKANMPNYDRLIGQSMNYKKRGWGFVLFVFLLSGIAALIISYFEVKFNIAVNVF